MEILNYCEQPSNGSIAAIFSLTIPALGMTFHKVKLIRTKKGGLMIAFPSYSEEQADGTKKWLSLIELSDARKTEFNKKVMEALNPFLRGPDFVV
jgi:hypothetical protein